MALNDVQVLGALVVALLVCLVGALPAVALSRRLGRGGRRRTRGGRHSPSGSFPGAALLAVAATIGFGVSYGLSPAALSAIGGAVVFFVLGLSPERSGRRPFSGGLRLGIQVVAAALTAGAGFRPGVLQPAWLDAMLAVVLLVVGARSVRSLETGARAAAPLSVGAAAAVMLLGVQSGQPLVGVLAASLCGATLGFILPIFTYDRLSVGRSGALFLGFLLMAATMRLRLAGGGSRTLLVIACCFAVPLTNAWVIALSRFLAGRPLRSSSRDGLVPRLVKLGLSVQSSILVLAGAAALGGAAAVLSVGLGSSVPALAVVAAFGLGGIALQRVDVYGALPPRRGRQIAVGAVALVGVALGVSLLMVLLAQRDLQRVRTDLLAARKALDALDIAKAQASVDRAQPEAERAIARLTSWATVPARLVPGLGNNVAVATSLARSSEDLVAAGREGVSVLQALRLQQGHGLTALSGGAIDLQPFVDAQRPAALLDQAVAHAQAGVIASPAGFLLPPVRKARADAQAELAAARRVADDTQAAMSLLPQALGSGAPQVWVIGAEDNAEARGRGGYMGAMAVVIADKGKVTLSAFGDTSNLAALPPTSTVTSIPPEYPNHYAALGAFGAWQNLTMSPSFANGATMLLSMLQASGAIHPTGLVGLDPEALSNLLAVTGPVRVPGIPEALTSDNVVSWSLNKIFFLYPKGKERHNVLALVAGAVWQRILSGSLDPRRLAEAMGRSLAGNHLAFFAEDPRTQELVTSLALGGQLVSPPGDYLLVDGQNVGENKLDYYAKRKVTYQAQVGNDRAAEVTLTVALTNTAPAGVVLPDELGGARPDIGLAAGTNRTYLSVLVPHTAILEDVRINGQSTSEFENLPEVGKRLFGVNLEAGPGATSSVQFRYAVPEVVVGGRYRLTVQNQASVNPDQLSVQVATPADEVVVADGGLGSGLAWAGRLTSSKSFSVDLRQGLLARFNKSLEAVLSRSSARAGR